MKLKYFSINSYRSCIKTKFPLQDELTSLIGVNGSGKSNILNAIVLLKKAFRSNFHPRDIDSSFRNICKITADLDDQGDTINIKANIAYDTNEHNYDDGTFSRLEFKFPDYIKNSKWINFPFPLLGLQSSLFDDDSLIDERVMYRLLKYIPYSDLSDVFRNKRIRQFFPKLFSFFNGTNYYSASQFSDPSRCPVSMELEENRPLKRSRSDARHEQFMLDLYRSYKADDTQYKRYFNTIGSDGIGLVDKVQFLELPMPSSYYKVEPSGKISKIERNRLLVVPRFTVNNTELSPNQLSEGTFKTLALVFYILTDDSELLLIEEPEVCIHHGLLSSIISLIKTQSRTKQIVMSTHSDFVLDHLDPENILLVKWLSDKGTIAKPLNKSISKNDYRALRVYLEKSGNLGEYLKEGGIENG